MKVLILAAIIAAAASSPFVQEQTWPWQVGKVYHYDVFSHTWVDYEKGVEKGNKIKMQYIVSVKAVGRLQAKIENPRYSMFSSDSEFTPIQNLNQTFDIFVNGGRVVSIDFPSSLSVPHENVIKSFVSALQVDFSTHGIIREYPNNFNNESFQGLFKKMEYDLTGECETLYSVSPVSAEWRQELQDFDAEEDPIEIVKAKDYGSCFKRESWTFGVPEDAVWKGTAKNNHEKQLIQHISNTRMLVGKQGTIYNSKVISSVTASPVVYGKQKAVVNTVVTAYLKSVENDNSVEWEKCKDCRTVNSLMYTTDNAWRLFTYGDDHNVGKAQQILQEITPWLQNPNQLEKGNFLMQFNTLVYLLFSMNSQQLTQMTSSIEIARTSKNVAKNGMWIIYRDAVAESGNPRAFSEIKSWILTKKIEGYEAAHVITAIGATLSPSKAVVTDFFNFAICPEVQGQKGLNNSALLAATRLLRFSNEKPFIVETVIPHLSKELKQAIENGETSKAQVYVVALGNLAHPSILKAFAPYLEGQVTVTKYLRTQMVTSLKTLANLRNSIVRTVLYSILRNTAEPYEVRVAAALNIFLAFPSAEMFQVMARMANSDHSTQVRAVLTTSIKFAAKLKDPRFAYLAKRAKAVVPLISEENFGYSYSTDSLTDHYTSDDDFSFFRELSFIGSENSLLPKYHRSALRFKGTAFGDERQVTFSISDVQDMVGHILSNIIWKPIYTKPTFKYSAKQIIEALNIKRPARQPLEGALFVENLNQQKLVTFNKDDFYAFFNSKGVDVHFTKILRHNQIYVDIPIASGMSFTYQYSEPMILSIQEESKVIVENKTGIFVISNHEHKINVTYARNIVGTVGFMDTIGEVLVGAGVINKLQVHIPGKIKTNFKLGGELSVVIEPLHADNDINLVHMSVTPYTGTQKKDSITYHLDTIKRLPKDLVSTQFRFGYLTGMHYAFEGQSYSSDYKNVEELFTDDLLVNIGTLLYQKDVAFTEYNFKYLKTSPAKSVTFTLFFDMLYNQNNSGEMGAATLTEHTEPNNLLRRADIAKKASTGIKAAQVILVDISAVFDGEKKLQYVFTGAYAKSFVDPKFQAAFVSHLDGFEQISAVFKFDSHGAKIVPLNFEQALKNKIKIIYDADFKYGHNMTVHLQGYGERSKEYTQMLKNSLTGKSCLQDVSNNNFYQKDCHKMIIKAHAPDYFKASVTYKGENSIYWQLLDIFYKYLKDENSWEEEITPFVKIGDNKLEIEAKSFYLDNYDSYNFTTKYGLLSVNNVESMWYDVYASAVYAPITSWERSRNWFTDYQYLPYCAVDDNKVRTFSGRSYDYKLTSSWHVVMVDESDDFSKFDDLVILVRRPSDNKEEVYISYTSPNGKYVELEIKPNNVSVKSDGVKSCEGELTMYWAAFDQDFYGPLLEYYTLAEGVQVFNLNGRHIRLVYDHHRLIIFTDEHRSTTRGICGQSSGQTRDDYLTPWGLVNSPQHYGASFSLEGEFSDPNTEYLKKEAKLNAYQPVTKFSKFNSVWNIDNSTIALQCTSINLD